MERPGRIRGHQFGNGEVEEDVVAGDPVVDVRRPRMRNQQPGDLAVRTPVPDAVLNLRLDTEKKRRTDN